MVVNCCLLCLDVFGCGGDDVRGGRWWMCRSRYNGMWVMGVIGIVMVVLVMMVMWR